MNSEHISYKSTRKLLKNLFTSGEHVIQGPGENAGLLILVKDMLLLLELKVIIILHL